MIKAKILFFIVVTNIVVAQNGNDDDDIMDNVKFCDIKCSPEDEDFDQSTGFFHYFGPLLFESFLFGDNEKTCVKSGEPITIPPNDDFLWNFVKRIYAKRTNDDITSKTLNDCYCEFNQDEAQCKSEAFKQCLNDVRMAMMNEINDFWANEFEDELNKRADNC